MRILTGEDIKKAITMSQTIEAVREGFIALSSDRVKVPIRSVLKTPDGVMLTMPAHIEGDPINVVKIVSVNEDNAQRNLPLIHAVVLVTDVKTGMPLAILDGATLTALRTGAASGVATDLLANPEASILGIIGAGTQARTQIEAVCAVRPITEIRIFSLYGAERMVDELHEKYDAEIVIADTAHSALEGAEVIVAATNSRTPVIMEQDISPGTHINGIGSFTPQMQEVAAEVVIKAKVIVDHRPSIWEEAGDLIIPRDQGLITEDHIFAEIGEIAAGFVSGRANRQEITFFKSVGNAVQDAIVAQRVLELAAHENLGSEISI